MFSAPPHRAELESGIPPRAERDAALSRFDPRVIIALYRNVGLQLSRGEKERSSRRKVASLNDAATAISLGHAATRVKIPPVMHGKFGHGRLPLAKGRSMQIRHEISLIVVCRMTEAGNRPFCGPGSDRPKTATRRRCRAERAL